MTKIADGVAPDAINEKGMVRTMALQNSVIEIDINDVNAAHAMEKAGPFNINTGLYISVPDNYYADLYLEGEFRRRIRPCVRKKVKSFLGRESLGRELGVLYVKNRPLTEMTWGIGNLPLVYNILGRVMTLKVGANGTFLAEMTDPAAFFQYFSGNKRVMDMTEIVSRITSAFRKYASGVLVKLFIDAGEPVLDTDFLLDETVRRLDQAICEAPPDDRLPGVIFRWVTVSSICVREEDALKVRKLYREYRREVEERSKKRKAPKKAQT